MVYCAIALVKVRYISVRFYGFDKPTAFAVVDFRKLETRV